MLCYVIVLCVCSDCLIWAWPEWQERLCEWRGAEAGRSTRRRIGPAAGLASDALRRPEGTRSPIQHASVPVRPTSHSFPVRPCWTPWILGPHQSIAVSAISIPAQEAGDVDRLSSLPPELISLIFSHLNSPSTKRPSAPVLSRALLPHAQKQIYSRLHIRTGTKLRRLVRTILSAPALGGHVRELHVAVPPDEASVPFYSAAQAESFWGAFPKLNKLGIAFQTEFLESLIEFRPADAVERRARGEAALRGLTSVVFTELQLPNKGVFCPRKLDNLFHTAPNVAHFVLSLDEDENVEDLPTDAPPYQDEPWPLTKLELSGPLSHLVNASVALCNIHRAVVELGVSEDTEDGNLATFLDKIDHSRLTSLELNAYTREEFDIDLRKDYDKVKHLRLDYHAKPAHLTKLPPNLESLRLGPDNRPSLALLASLLAPGRAQLAHLQYLRVDHEPPSLGRFARARPVGASGRPRFAPDPAGQPVIQPSSAWNRPAFTAEWAHSGLKQLAELAEGRGVRLKGGLLRALRVEEAYLAELEACAELAGRQQRGELEWEPKTNFGGRLGEAFYDEDWSSEADATEDSSEESEEESDSSGSGGTGSSGDGSDTESESEGDSGSDDSDEMNIGPTNMITIEDDTEEDGDDE